MNFTKKSVLLIFLIVMIPIIIFSILTFNQVSVITILVMLLIGVISSIIGAVLFSKNLINRKYSKKLE